ncbi:D-amino-acid oxidase [Coccidioides immitis H538.4]|nr:D-amino-acid oxidase [Coccidioides immitis H538.4]
MYSVSGTDDGPNEAGYIMMRAAGGGTILGGCYQRHNYESQPDPNLAIRIMKRCVALCPELVGKDANGNQRGIEALDIVRHGVGLRPLREGGPRVERDNIGGVSVIHNYGHGGFGYQASFGTCADAVALVEKALDEKKRRARL